MSMSIHNLLTRWGLGSAVIAVLCVSGLVWAFSNQVSIKEQGGYRYIFSNGIPDHHTGQFPNGGNPHTISEQRHRYRVSASPKVAANITRVELWPMGVAINGVPFDPGAAEFWNRDRSSGWRYEALSGSINLGLDSHNAHVQPNGAYHYHGIPSGVVAGQQKNKHSKLIGYAADGFPIYALYGYVDPSNPDKGVKKFVTSHQVKKGFRRGGPGGEYTGTFVQDYEYVKGLGDLDDCNGRSGKTPEYPNGTYAYFLTEAYPVIPRCLKGAPDPSFTARRGMGSRPGGRRPPPHMQDGQRRPPPHFPPPRDGRF